VPLAFHQVFFLQAFANLNFLSPALVLPKTRWRAAATGAEPATKLREAALALVGGGDHQLLLQLSLDFSSIANDSLHVSSLIQWNPAPAPATTPAMPGDSSGSSNYPFSPSRYDERDALQFKAERDETRHELEDVSKKARITELEWEHQRKQLLETIYGESRDLF
jgi:hypothetical protein